MAMNLATELYEIEREDETLLLTPVTDLGEMVFQVIEAETGPTLDLLSATSARNVVLDFGRTDYFGTTALGFFIKLWKKVRSLGGHMAFCNVSEHEMEILRLTKLDHLWSICPTREEALGAVKG
jgi:anti-sigma B factor antagonist